MPELIEKDVMCPFCATEASHFGFTEYWKCPACGTCSHVEALPETVRLVGYEGKAVKHKVEAIDPRTKEPKGELTFRIPPGFEPSHEQWLNYDNSCRCIREICSSCIKKSSCGLLKAVRHAMGENYPIFPADWLIIRQSIHTYFELRDHNTYVICYMYDDGQTDLFEKQFPKAHYLPQASKKRYVWDLSHPDNRWAGEVHTLKNVGL